MKSLRELYSNHKGYVSDKWEIYLDEYDRLFKELKHKPLSLLEIGVQNGGSLQILASYFENARALVGCDIDLNCRKLQFDDPRIKLVIGDVNVESTERNILNCARKYDIIIDDGSHKSSDIANAFIRYFPLLKTGGLYIVEDLHCSYWKEFDGGLFYPSSSINFFKKIVDVINYEHWGINAKRSDVICGFEGLHILENIEDNLASIHSIEYVNSLCIVKKKNPNSNLVGKRIIAGKYEEIKQGHHELGFKNCVRSQEDNRWSRIDAYPELNDVKLQKKINDIHSLSADTNLFVQEMDNKAEYLMSLLENFSNEMTRHIKNDELKDAALAGLEEIKNINEQRIKEYETEIKQLNLQLSEAVQRNLDQAKTVENLEIQLAQSKHRLNSVEEKMNRMGLGKKWIKTDFFDSKYYMRSYPDLVQHNVDPVVHYLFYGQFEKRRACPPKSLLSLIPVGIANRGGLARTALMAMRKYRNSGMPGVKKAIDKVKALDPSYTLHGNYADWINKYDAISDDQRARIRRLIQSLEYKPKLSVIMPVYNPVPEFLIQAIESVKNQLYDNWELCIADDKSSNSNVLPIIDRYSREDSRIHKIFREKNGHISEASNSALACANGDFIVLLDQDDILAEHALFYIAKAINENSEADLIYSDEDKITEDGVRYEPYFKSDFDPLLFMAQNMISHLGAYRTSLVKEIGGFRVGLEGSQDWDLALRVYENSSRKKIHHIPRVLYHWRAAKGSTALSVGEKDYAINAGRKAVSEYLARTGHKASVIPAPEAPHLNRVIFERKYKGLISIIIPTRDKSDILSDCIDSIISRSSYPNYEFIIVDNGSVEDATLRYLNSLPANIFKIIRDDEPFNFSRLNNLAAVKANGEILCFVNNDIEIITPDWMEEMASFAVQNSIGCVGARLWYPNGELQHGGVLLGIGGVASHAHYKTLKGHQGYFGRAVLHQEYSAVTAAVLMMRKEIFNAIDGFDEKLAVAFNDVDLCLRVKQAGYRNVWTPYAQMVHHESKSRGTEDTPEKLLRFQRENEFMNKRWEKVLNQDPAYNPNLCLAAVDFELAWPPRVSQMS